MYEFHPLKWIFGETDKPEIIDAYFTPAEGFRLAGVTYADATAPIAETPTIQRKIPWAKGLGPRRGGMFISHFALSTATFCISGQ